jgi:hypothetical protein
MQTRPTTAETDATASDATVAPAGAPQPPPSRYSLKPALIVGGLAVVILIAFSLGSAFTHTPPSPSKAPTGSVAVKGSSLRAVAAQSGLKPIEQDGQPPANVVAAITLPEGATRLSSTDPGEGSTYDQSVQFSVNASEAAVLGFYKTELHAFGWTQVTSGAATHQAGQQLVGQIAGDDGFYWQVGVIVSPSTFGALGTSDVTRFTIRLLQVGDDS